MRSTNTTIRDFGILGLVVALVLGIVVAAVQAEGPRTVRPDTHDGGAWLVNHSAGAIGHVNRSTGEISEAVRLAEPGQSIDTEQSGQTIAVINSSTQVLTLVDARTARRRNEVSVVEDLQIRLVGTDALLWTTSPLRVWRSSLSELGQIESLSEIEPEIDRPNDGIVDVSRFGQIIAVDTVDSLLIRLPAADDVALVTDLGGVGPEVVQVGASGDSTLLLTRSGGLLKIEPESDELGDLMAMGNVAALAQPSLPGEPIIAVSDDGSILSLDLATGEVLAVTVGRLTGSDPLRPIFHRGCVFAVTTNPPELTRSCAGVTNDPRPLEGTTGRSLRLRLVNDNIWVNDVRAGIMWVINEESALDRIDDWGAALGDEGEDDSETEEVEDGEIEQRENPDADDAALIRADEIDEDGENEKPVARDDVATTRVDVPVIVHVLSNDEDPDGDVLLIDSATAGPEGSTVIPTGGRQTIQVAPRAGFTGQFSFEYTITDGRGGSDSATVTIDVIDPATNENRPPNAVTDATTARAGSSAALNVLENDSDPDGDTIVLTAITAASGSITFDGSGQVTFAPDPTSAEGTVELSYTIADTYGLTAEGKVLVSIRLRESNTPPDARSDSAVAVTGRPVALNVLLNDTDPDGDAISVAGPPTLISPADSTAEIDLSPDGQLFFVADQPGQYLYRYTIIDAQQQDTALIRIEVLAAEENRPPVAVRDDITVPRGGTSTAYVLDNDFDPDGDVVSISTWESADFLDVSVFRGVGLVVAVDAAAPPDLAFRYTITDGVAEPVTGVVVVAVSDVNGVNQPPVVKRDVVEVRPGRTASVAVLLNDFDPEGGTLRVDRVSAIDEAQLRIGAAAQEVLVTLPDDAISGFTFAYEVADDVGNRSPGFVDVRIVPVDTPNRPPTALTDIARTRNGVALVIPVLANDSDPDGDIVRVESIAAQPTSGAAVLNDDGTISYTPERGFAGTDRFQYVAVDPFDGRDVAEVLVGVMPDTGENRPPTARDDRITVIVGSDIVRLPVLDNDSDPDSDPITITRASGGSAVSITDDSGALDYTPPVSLEGIGDGADAEVSIAYSISDGRGGNADAIVTIDLVTAVEPQAPQPQDDVVGPVREGDSVEVDVLANDVDPDGRSSELTVRSNDGAGRPGQAPGSLAFVAGPATSVHPYTVTDPQGLSAEAFVTIVVTENLAPVVSVAAITTPFDTPVSLRLGGQVSDPDGDDLFFVCCDDTRGGAASIETSTVGVLDVVFTPDPGHVGPAGFSFNVDDQRGHVVSGVAQITVLPKENSAPTAVDSVFEIEAGTNGTVSLAALADDADLGTGDSLTFAISNVSLAGVSLNGNSADRATVNVQTAIEDAGNTGSFAYTVTDAAGESASATVSVVVTESNLPRPIAQPDSAKTTQGVAVTIPVLTNDVDFTNQGLRLVSAGSTTSVGSVSADAASGLVTYTPSADFFGTANLVYTIQDARNREGGQADGTIAVDVTGFPGPPPTPVAAADNSTATVTWGQPAANGAAIDSFEVEPSVGATRTVDPSSSATFNNLTNGTPITFRVRAHNEAGWGDWSQASAPVTPDTQPGRPGPPTVVFGDQELVVSWTEPQNEGTPVASYILEIGGGAQQAPRPDIGTTTYRWQNLTNGVSYRFRVTAVNAAGNSDVSPWSTAEHPLREPDATAPIAVTRGNRYLDLNWSAPANNGDPIAQYRVEMESQPGQYAPVTGRTYRWANLPNGVTQRYRVQAKNRDADWGAPSPWSTPVKPCGTPAAGNAPSVARGDRQVRVQWTPPADGGCAISGYTVVAVGTGLSRSVPAGTTTLDFDGLTNGTSYRFQVLATNEEGDGPLSAQSGAAIPAGPPFAATNLNAGPGTGLGEAVYTFTRPSDNGDAITEVWLRVNGGGREVASLTSATRGVRSALAPNTGYTFEVQFCNTVGCGGWSNASSFTTDGPPSTPSGFYSNSSDYRVAWYWNAVSANGPGFFYDFELNNGFLTDPQRLDRGTTTNYINSSATPYFVHASRVRACNSLGCSGWTSYVEAQATRPVSVVVSKGAATSTGCPVGQSCNWLRLNASGLIPPGAFNAGSYTVRCFYEGAQGQTITGLTGTVTADSNGDVSQNICSFSLTGRLIWLTLQNTAGGTTYTSNAIRW